MTWATCRHDPVIIIIFSGGMKMVNLAILSILALVLLITRRPEGTVKIRGLFSFGMVGARLGRVGVFAIAYRPNRFYFKVALGAAT